MGECPTASDRYRIEQLKRHNFCSAGSKVQKPEEAQVDGDKELPQEINELRKLYKGYDLPSSPYVNGTIQFESSTVKYPVLSLYYYVQYNLLQGFQGPRKMPMLVTGMRLDRG